MIERIKDDVKVEKPSNYGSMHGGDNRKPLVNQIFAPEAPLIAKSMTRDGTPRGMRKQRVFNPYF